MRGKKEVLGLWIAENERAKFWAGVLNELRNRGVEDILIACMDGLTGFPDAVRAVYPKTHIQRCIVHMVRSSTKFASYRDLKKVCADLKTIYTAPSETAGRTALEAFGEFWNAKYPMIYQAWDTSWTDLCEFFQYPPEIRRAIYTSNAIESVNYQLRSVAKQTQLLRIVRPLSTMILYTRSCFWRYVMSQRNGRCRLRSGELILISSLLYSARSEFRFCEILVSQNY